MADPFPIAVAQIVALFMECVCYGIYLVTLFQCLRALLWSSPKQSFKGRGDINWPMLIAALLLGIFATLDVAFGLRHVLVAFVYYKGEGGAAAELRDISYWVNVMKIVDYSAQTLIGDALLVYRCYHVWGRSWKIIIPSVIAWLGGLALCIVMVITFATLNTDALLNASKAVPFLSTAIAITLTMNVVTSCLIVYRIWSIDTKTRRHSAAHQNGQASRLKHVVHVMIESAALYTVSVFIFVCLYAAQNNASYAVSDCVVQIIGISFNVIIIRVSATDSAEGSQSASTVTEDGKRHLRKGSHCTVRSHNSYATAIEDPDVRKPAGQLGDIVPSDEKGRVWDMV